jgi:secreted trypsin-like serine protease
VQGLIFVPKGEQIHHNDVESRIYGGEFAKLGQYPYFTLLYINVEGGTYICGGSVIDKKFILTVSKKNFKFKKILNFEKYLNFLM